MTAGGNLQHHVRGSGNGRNRVAFVAIDNGTAGEHRESRGGMGLAVTTVPRTLHVDFVQGQAENALAWTEVAQ